MKIICDCGAETELIEEKSNEIESEYGIYCNEGNSDIQLWEEHDIVGIVCKRCEKAVWVFV